MAATPPQPPPAAPGPPTGPPTAPPPAPGVAPPKRGVNGWLIGFIVVAVLLVVSLIFGIFSYTGKNDESDKKDKAQKELAATKKKLGTSEAAGSLLGNLVKTGATAADDLKSCADTSRDFITAFSNAIGQIVGGGGVPPELQAAATNTDSKCATADSSYNDFVDAIRKLQNS